MIITQAGQPKPEVSSEIDEIPTTKHFKWEETKSNYLTLGEVNIQRYNGRKRSGMPEQYSVEVVPTLAFLSRKQISLQRAAVEDMLFLRQVTESASSLEYNGFNTKCARESGQKTGIIYTPFLDDSS